MKSYSKGIKGKATERLVGEAKIQSGLVLNPLVLDTIKIGRDILAVDDHPEEQGSQPHTRPLRSGFQ